MILSASDDWKYRKSFLEKGGFFVESTAIVVIRFFRLRLQNDRNSALIRVLKGVRGVCPEKLSARQHSAGVVFRFAKQAESVLARPTGATG